ncbi:hypothetical protein UO65_2846 [Actinokineospora spheciospongiae]|uniref:Uncharacterized protein n=1 Tax=Actinokineospora spheciospongiae TaxID=909613 RepID=W7IY50_9PSEU|nr:hypothetical protein UO65_2846 [Actinokineospora spheciospongiae]
MLGQDPGGHETCDPGTEHHGPVLPVICHASYITCGIGWVNPVRCPSIRVRTTSAATGTPVAALVG